ncbi:SymE family type I addiction module toxin [Erwinia sp. BNK-24-b]|uniref:SymE family type I addiction module toxin n=1 Tax=unclassified Erwinia TaxID=2622719 RepID=UPI0039BF69D9
MTTSKRKSERVISRTERHLQVGYRPNQGDTSIPMISFSGKWLLEAGFEPGIGISLKVLEGCLVLIVDSREQKRLKALEKVLVRQRTALEQARQQIKASI